MRNILAIARKELSIYFTTPWAYVVFTLMVLLASYWFQGLLQEFTRAQEAAQQVGWERLGPEAAMYRNLTDGVVLNLWNVILFVTIFFTPVISMRLFADEKRSKTFELLMTAPVRPSEIVIGKYLGGLGVISATIGITIIYPVILSIFGSSESGTALEWSTVLLGYLGVLLCGACCVAVGMFISSLTESQLLAALGTFVVLLIWFALSWAAQWTDDPWRGLINSLSLQAQLAGLMKGVLELKGLVFFLSVILFANVLTHRAVEAQRWG